MRVGRSIKLCVVLQGGVYLQAVIDKFSASYATFILAIVFNIALAWVYGVPRLSRDIKAMVGHKVSLYWKILWKGLTPLLLLVSNVIIFVWEILLKTLMGVVFFFSVPMRNRRLGLLKCARMINLENYSSVINNQADYAFTEFCCNEINLNCWLLSQLLFIFCR